jgi:hypothetical protein
VISNVFPGMQNEAHMAIVHMQNLWTTCFQVPTQSSSICASTWLSRKIIILFNEWSKVNTVGVFPLMAPSVPYTNSSHTVSLRIAWDVLGSDCLPISGPCFCMLTTSAAEQGKQA